MAAMGAFVDVKAVIEEIPGLSVFSPCPEIEDEATVKVNDMTPGSVVHPHVCDAGCTICA